MLIVASLINLAHCSLVPKWSLMRKLRGILTLRRLVNADIGFHHYIDRRGQDGLQAL
jgi:hypothetical protein